MSRVFNLAQITRGKSLAEWRPSNREDCKPPLLAVAPAANEPQTTTNQETKSMGIRADIRNAIEKKGVLTYAEIKEMFPGSIVATPLSQMASEGTLKRTGKGANAVYAIGRAPGSVRKPRTAKAGRKPGSKRKSKNRLAFKFTRAHNGNGAPPSNGAIAQTIIQLRLRRDLIDNTIVALEQLPA